MAPKFGTSGLRGLVTELTPALVGDHVRSFADACPTGTGLFIGYDLRPSSPDIAKMVTDAAVASGVPVTECGAVPTPALALASQLAGASAVMITGSHIPADRNGLKFYTPEGEITKAHEAAILGALGQSRSVGDGATVTQNDMANDAYVSRFASAFGDALAGRTIGVYAHSSVGRDVLAGVLKALGAEVIELGRSEVFIPVDTEAVDPAVRAELKEWAAIHDLDAIVSTDGDGDRPLVTDATGEVIPGDILGQITAAFLGADSVVTPVSSNTGAEASGRFNEVVRTRIGSPYVIAGMEKTGGRVVGYEANGGFLLGFEAAGPAGPLPPLMTRDAVLPIVAPLAAMANESMAALVAAQPSRFTAADRLQNVETAKSAAFVSSLVSKADERAAFLKDLGGAEAGIDQTDGLRMTLQDGRIVHVRPSGNAPELRLYVEAHDKGWAEETLALGLKLMRSVFA